MSTFWKYRLLLPVVVLAFVGLSAAYLLTVMVAFFLLGITVVFQALSIALTTLVQVLMIARDQIWMLVKQLMQKLMRLSVARTIGESQPPT